MVIPGFPELSASDVGLAGLVTIAVLMLFFGRLVPYKWHKETLDSNDKLQKAFENEQAKNKTLVDELTPAVKQILDALPNPADEGR